jgi:hypothetical protein
MRLLACLVLLVVAMPAAAVAGSVTRTPAEDVGPPFWCDWGSDWDERCYAVNTEASFSSSPRVSRTSV